MPTSCNIGTLFDMNNNKIWITYRETLVYCKKWSFYFLKKGKGEEIREAPLIVYVRNIIAVTD